jgi:S1-C subfamily serine protease
VILEVDGQAVENPEAFGYRYTLKGIEGRTPLTVLRDGKRMPMQVQLLTPPETRPRDPVHGRARTPFAGATLVNVSPAVADELQIDVSQDGIVMSDVEDTGIAARVGFQKGDLILAVNGQRLATTKDIERVMRNGGGYWEITLNRGGRVFTMALGG